MIYDIMERTASANSTKRNLGSGDFSFAIPGSPVSRERFRAKTAAPGRFGGPFRPRFCPSPI